MKNEQDTVLELYPAYELYGSKGKHSPFNILNSEVNDKDIEKFLGELIRYNSNQKPPKNISVGIKSLLRRDNLIIAGGLIAEKGEFTLYPGCCSGLESWREWFSVRQGSHSPWLGHDPDPYIDTTGNNAILHTGHPDNEQTLEVSYTEIKNALTIVQRQFEGFANALEKYLSDNNLSDGSEFMDFFKRAFLIDDEAVLYHELRLEQAKEKLKQTGMKISGYTD